MYSLSSLVSTPTSESETVLIVAPWSSSSGDPHCTTTTTRLYCTIFKRTDHTGRLSCHFRSYNHCKKTGHTERECFSLHPVLLAQAHQRRKHQGLPPLHTFSAGSRAMSVGTIQLLSFDPIVIQYRLTRIELQPSASQHSSDPLSRPSLLT